MIPSVKGSVDKIRLWVLVVATEAVVCWDVSDVAVVLCSVDKLSVAPSVTLKVDSVDVLVVVSVLMLLSLLESRSVVESSSVVKVLREASNENVMLADVVSEGVVS